MEFPLKYSGFDDPSDIPLSEYRLVGADPEALPMGERLEFEYPRLAAAMVFYAKIDMRGKKLAEFGKYKANFPAWAWEHEVWHDSKGLRNDGQEHRGGVLDWVLESCSIEDWDGTYLPLDYCSVLLDIAPQKLRSRLLKCALDNPALTVDHWHAAKWRLEYEGRTPCETFFQKVLDAYSER
jgi:hypothetical protein